MTAFFRRHSTFILLSLLVTMLGLVWVFPYEGLFLGLTFLLFSFLTASLAVLDKHRQAYQDGRVGRGIFIRRAVLEISGTWLAMLLAAVLARYAAHAATGQIGDHLIRVIAGLAVGLLVGLSVGTLARKTLRLWVDMPRQG